MPSDREYMVVAVVSAGGVRRVVKCDRRPGPREVNLLYSLGEHVSRVITIEDLCHRLKVSHNGLKQVAHKLRRKLHRDWILDAVNGEGYRFCYVGSPLADADRTVVELNHEVLRRTRVQTRETRDKIRAAMLKNGARKNKRITEEHERNLHRRHALDRETI